jgi:hypothetical protein
MKSIESNSNTLEASVLDKNIKSLDLTLKDAVCEFRKDYILSVAQQTATFDIYSMSRTLNYDRSELSKFVNETDVKPQIKQLQETYNPNDWYTKNSKAKSGNAIIQEIISESIAENNFDIKKATTKFKKKYITQKVQQYGIDKAAKLLNVDERTIRNHLFDNYKIVHISPADLTTMVN